MAALAPATAGSRNSRPNSRSVLILSLDPEGYAKYVREDIRNEFLLSASKSRGLLMEQLK